MVRISPSCVLLKNRPAAAPDLPVAFEKPLTLYDRQCLQVGQVAGVDTQQLLVVVHGRHDERHRLRLVLLFRCCQIEAFPEFLSGVRPVNDLVTPNHVANEARTLRNGVAGVLVDPPRNELRNPAISVRVAGRSNERPDAAGRTVTGQHIEENLLAEMRQLVEADLADLSALPVVQLFRTLDVREGHLGNLVAVLISKRPRAVGDFALCPVDTVVHLLGFIPQTALGENLLVVLPEDRAAEALDILVSQRRQQQAVGLAAAGRSAVDADVRRGCKKLLLRAELRLQHTDFSLRTLAGRHRPCRLRGDRSEHLRNQRRRRGRLPAAAPTGYACGCSANT